MSVQGYAIKFNPGEEAPWYDIKYRNKIESVTIGNGVDILFPRAFNCISNMKTISLGSVQTIHSNAFINCTSLTSVDIPDSTVNVYQNSFVFCTGLTAINVSPTNSYFTSIDGVLIKGTSILKCPESKTFNGPYNIPDEIKEISDEAFMLCSKLTEVNIHANVVNIGNCSFALCHNLIAINSNSSNLYFKSHDGVLYRDSSYLFQFPGGKSVVTFKDYVSKIKSYSFYGNTKITSIQIPDTVTEIHQNAFDGCTGLTSIIIPDSVRILLSDAFRGCDSLKCIEIGNQVSDFQAFSFPYPNLENLTIGYNIKSIPAIGCPKLKVFKSTTNSTTYAEHIFDGCVNLETIEVTCSKLPAYSFANCIKLTSVTFKNPVKTIDDYAFSNCISLESFKFPDAVTTVGTSVFHGCTNLKKVDFNKASNIETVNLNGSNIEDLTFGNVETIQSYQFSNCHRLININLDNVKNIDSFAFYNCSSLTHICIPKTLKTFGTNPFFGCNNVEKVEMSEYNPYFTVANGALAITYDFYLGKSLAYYPPALKGEHLTTTSFSNIESYAFASCRYLKSIEIVPFTSSISETSFYNTSIVNFTCVATSAYSNFEFIYSFRHSLERVEIEALCFEESFENFTALKYALLNTQKTYVETRCFYNCTNLETVIIDETVLRIYKYSFALCSNLVNVHLSENLESIYSNAFANCTSLKSIYIPYSTYNIEPYAFAGCTSLTSISIGTNAKQFNKYILIDCPNVKEVEIRNQTTDYIYGPRIADGVVYNEYCDTIIYVPPMLNVSLNLPNNLTVIPDHAFENTKITKVAFGSRVKYIGEDAFANCQDLEYVAFSGEVQPSCSFKSFENSDNIKYALVQRKYYYDTFCSIPLKLDGISNVIYVEIIFGIALVIMAVAIIIGLILKRNKVRQFGQTMA